MKNILSDVFTKRNIIIILLGALAIIATIVIAEFSFGKPHLTAVPLEDNVDYYIISINGKEFNTSPSFDMQLLYDIEDLSNGVHEVKLTPVSRKDGKGESVSFFLIKYTFRASVFYEIKDIHFDRFEEGELKIQIKKK